MTIETLLDQVVVVLKKFSSELEDMDAIFQLDIQEKPYESFQLLIHGANIEWRQTTVNMASCVIQITRQNLFKLLEGKLNPTSALITGKLKIQGDHSQLMKLQSILSKHEKELYSM